MSLPLPKLGWAEGHAPIHRYVQALARVLTMSANSPWTLVYPTDLSQILTDSTSDHIAILSTRPFAASANPAVLEEGGAVKDIVRYLRIRKPGGGLTYINLQIGTRYEPEWAPSAEQSTDYSVIGTRGGTRYLPGDILSFTLRGRDSLTNLNNQPLKFTITVTSVTPTQPINDPENGIIADMSGPITGFTVAIDPSISGSPSQSTVQVPSQQNIVAAYDASSPNRPGELGINALFSLIAVSEYSPAYGGPTTNPVGSYLPPSASSVEVRYYWYIPDTLINFPIDDTIQVQYFMSFYGYTGDKEDSYSAPSDKGSYVSMIQIGDPTVDTPNFTHYQITPAYIGAVEPYSSSNSPVAVNPSPDFEYNWMLTAGSFVAPLDAGTPPLGDPISNEQFVGFDKKYGNNTGTGNTDIIAAGTRYGVRFQAHQVSMTTINPFMAKLFLSASQWTHKYHSSKVIVTHATERERGTLQGTIIFDRSSIFNLDELYFNRGEDDERIYKTFLVNSNANFISNSANVLYTLALLKFDKQLSPMTEG